jgi:glucose-1-phosphate cytidylyltransferase
MGFIICEKEIFDYLDDDLNSMLVGNVLPKLAEKGKLGSYKHGGFFEPMDSFKDYTQLNKKWKLKEAKWKIW